AGALLLAAWIASNVLQQLNKESAFSGPAASFENPINLDKVPTPSLFDEATKALSIVIPAYNEEFRLGSTLDETFSYLQRRRDQRGPYFTYEVIVVDDGSQDATVGCAAKFTRKHGVDALRTLRLPQNRGKGYAVRAGVLVARGQNILLMDADGATRVSDLERLESAAQDVMQQGKESLEPSGGSPPHQAFVLGSRAYLEESSKAKRTALRTFLMHGFHFLVALVVGRSIRDTQCGFKLFTRDAARRIFPNQRLQRWCFDVELVHLAQSLNASGCTIGLAGARVLCIPMAEVQVTWTEIPGSKLRVTSVISMALELVLIKVGYGTGAWPLHGHLDLQR
ncbi:hypothetical protein APUTEX25_001058, partial [Auxenochlorella protothecoides]